MRRGCLTSELRAAEYVAEEVVVVEAPDAIRSRWFEVVCRLHISHDAQVFWEDDQDKGWESGVAQY